MAEPQPAARFGPVVLAGLASGALTAVASAKPWFRAAVDAQLLPGVRDADTSADMPLALALALVVLAGWGAVLVSRGRARRLVLAVAAAAAVGVVACVVAAPLTLPDDVRGRLLPGTDEVAVSATGWYVAAAVAAVLSAAFLAAAWVLVPRWPTMSNRYDAPGGGPAAEPRTATELWKALDEGHDPTDPQDRTPPPSP